MSSILLWIFTLIALAFLIFIHELGHFLVAKWVGAKVLSFNIGFGKSLFSFENNGVKWRINILPLGGGVEIEGLSNHNKDNAQKVGSYYSLSPWRRIAIVLAGPIANIVCALVFFTILFSFGGRTKDFHEVTQYVGMVDRKSSAYMHGLRPGDRIESYNGYEVSRQQDHLVAAMLSKSDVDVRAWRYDWKKGVEFPWKQSLSPYTIDAGDHTNLRSIGIISPASQLIVRENRNQGSGVSYDILKNDQIVWVNGRRIFSLHHLQKTLNDKVAYVVVERQGQRLGLRIPTVVDEDLKYDNRQSGTLTDWLLDHPSFFQAHEVRMLPYVISRNAEVRGSLELVAADVYREKWLRLEIDKFKKGDKILAINGHFVESRDQIFDVLQKKNAQVIVYRPSLSQTYFIKKAADADEEFRQLFSQPEIDRLALGWEPEVQGDFVRIDSKQLISNEKLNSRMIQEARERASLIVEDHLREKTLSQINKWGEALALGVMIEDRPVIDNPPPFVLAKRILFDNGRTLYALFSGALNPKWLSGPVGMFSVVYKSGESGFGEFLYWLGLISLGLGVFNLLPIPALDGGHLLFNLLDALSPKRIDPIWLERLMVPFIFLIIGIFIFVTYWDISRLLGF